MASTSSRLARRHSQSDGNTRRRHMLLWLLVALLLAAAVPTVLYAVAHRPDATGSVPPYEVQADAALRQPADRFVQSIVIDDGALGWRQLCPSVQAVLSQDELVQQANAQRAAAAKQGLRLTAEYMGAQPRASGGELRVYVVTAHWSNGATQQRTYTVQTQASGCVEDVQNQ